MKDCGAICVFTLFKMSPGVSCDIFVSPKIRKPKIQRASLNVMSLLEIEK